MNYFASRWRSEIPLSQLLWWDMLLVGTTVNLVTTLASFIGWELGLGATPAALIFFAPLPYNMFLFLAVWRTSAGLCEPSRSVARGAAGLWAVVVTLV